MMNYKEFQKWTRTKSQRDMTPYNFATNMGLGLVEASEVIGEYKKIIFHKHPINKNLLKEFGDLNFYCSEIANIWDIDLQSIWDYVKYYDTVNMQGVESDLTDEQNKIIDELTELNKAAADLLFTIRTRNNWQVYNESMNRLVKCHLYSMMQSQKIILHLQGIKIEAVLQGNVEKLNKRYPNGFSSADSIARVDTNG